jgi:hypothetical protein
MTDVHTEIEQKFDVDPSYILPALDTAIPGANDVETAVSEMEAGQAQGHPAPPDRRQRPGLAPQAASRQG